VAVVIETSTDEAQVVSRDADKDSHGRHLRDGGTLEIEAHFEALLEWHPTHMFPVVAQGAGGVIEEDHLYPGQLHQHLRDQSLIHFHHMLVGIGPHQDHVLLPLVDAVSKDLDRQIGAEEAIEE